MIKLSCNLYSFNELLRDGAMTLEEAIAFCADLGFDAVDPTGYYFPGYPHVPEDDYIHHIKKFAFLRGLDISGTGLRNDFTLPDPEARREEEELVKRWVHVAATLDAPVLRIFAGHPDAALFDEHDRADVLQWVVESIRSCVDYAKTQGVMLVLQNHNAVLKTASDVLDLHERVNSDWFGLNVDIGSLRTGDPYSEIALLAPFAYTWQIKEHVYRSEVQEKTDMKKLVAVIQEAGYRGYIPLEVLPPGDPEEELPRFLEQVRYALSSSR